MLITAYAKFYFEGGEIHAFFYKTYNFCAYHLHTSCFHSLLNSTKEKRGLSPSFFFWHKHTFLYNELSALCYYFTPLYITMSTFLFRQNSPQILTSSRFFNFYNLFRRTSRYNISTIYSPIRS